MTQGIDYSHGGPLTSAQIKAAGKSFVGRYAVNDHSPNGRGIDADEYAELTAGGVEVFVYWESSEGWMLDGFAAGAVAAVNAQQNLNAAGMPDLPIYFACDFDATPGQQPQIDDCLSGCASVLGIDRVGLYAGYFPLLRSKQNGTSRWWCQTLAWSGRRVLDGAHLYQFDTIGNFIAGVDVDLVEALLPHYGQASDFTGTHEPHYATPAPISWAKGDVGEFDQNGAPAVAFLIEVTANVKATPKQSSAKTAKDTGPEIAKGDKRVAIGAYRAGVPKNGYLVLEDGSRVKRSAFRPLVPLPKAA